MLPVCWLAFAGFCLALPCFTLVCLALPCLALLHLAWPYFTHALSVPLLLRFLGFLDAFFALVAHFFDFFTHLKLSCIFVRFFEVFGVIFRGFGRVWGVILGGFFDDFW